MCLLMKKSHKSIIAVISSVVCTYVGMKINTFLRVDYCLDRGGMVTNSGACELGDNRVEMLSLSIPELMVTVVLCVLLFLTINQLLRFIVLHVVKK